MLASYARNYRLLWERHWWWRARRRFVLGLLDGLSRGEPFGRILDVGCGDGLFFDDLERYGEPWGVEPDESLVDPDGRWAPRIRRAAFDGADRDPGGYGLILMLDSIEHMEDDGAAARKAASLLSPGGVLLATVPALPSLWSVHDEANRHFRRYTRASLEAVLSGAGLRIESLGYYFGWTVLPMYARRLLGRGRGGGAAAREYAVAPPPAAVNAVMDGVCRLEQALTGRRGTPVGSSLFAVARRPEGS
jgi:SAM-dependent methyltransferase